MEVPAFLTVAYRPIYIVHQSVQSLFSWTARVLYWSPLFKTRLCSPAHRLFLYGGMPLVLGPLKITCGSDCRISGQTTFSGRCASDETAELKIGDNVDISWQTTIAVGRKIIIGDNVRIAGRGLIAGYPGHPVDAKDRAAGLPDSLDQVRDVILERDVWLGTGVSVMSGVTIGAETIVAAGSVVTKSLPRGVLAGGNPARVIRNLTSKDKEAA